METRQLYWNGPQSHGAAHVENAHGASVDCKGPWAPRITCAAAPSRVTRCTRRQPRGRAFAGACLLAAVPWLLPMVLEGQQTDTEVMAEYLYRLAQFTEWPPGVFGQREAVHICAASDDAFLRVLEATVRNRIAGGRAVEARRVATNQQARACHVLFLGDIGRTQIEGLLEATAGAPVLTVSDAPAFLSQGGMIQFTRQGTRIRFEVDLTAARAASLTLSADLLRAASVVRRR